jgi:hypothetical protein
MQLKEGGNLRGGKVKGEAPAAQGKGLIFTLYPLPPPAGACPFP